MKYLFGKDISSRDGVPVVREQGVEALLPRQPIKKLSFVMLAFVEVIYMKYIKKRGEMRRGGEGERGRGGEERRGGANCGEGLSSLW